MPKTLLICESPSKGKHISEYLGKDYIVMACYGHIADLAKGGRFGIGVDIEKDFKPHYILMEDKIKVLDDLIEAAKKCDQILLCPDPDKEGEAISWHLYQRLVDVGKPIRRATFNEIKKSAVLKAVKNTRDIDMKMFRAQEARRILDRLVGFMASPFLANIYGSNKLSAGRVQSVCTRMIIDREQDISAFKPEEFWTIQVSLAKANKDSFITKYSGKLIDQQSADAMNAKLNAKNAQFVVSEVISSEEAKYPQPPMITSTLQRIMSKEHNFSADRTMKAAQALYEQGCCTYIRTDSVRVGDEALQDAREWLTKNKHPIPSKPVNYKNKDAAQDAHECIRPSNVSLVPGQNYAIIDPDEKLVYQTIWKYFLASQMNPAIYDTLKMTAHIVGDKTAEVKASGKALKVSGYLDILDITDNSSIDIPPLVKGDILTHFGKKPVKMEKKQTQPPPRYSEDKLIKELVNKNIGRPSTFADLLSKITARNYVEKKGNVFHATELGKKITNELTQYFTFMDYDYTSKLEQQLDEIESGKISHLDVLKKFYPAFKKELDTAYLGHGSQMCEKCGSPMQVRKSKQGGLFMGCQSYPSCKNTINIPSQPKEQANSTI